MPGGRGVGRGSGGIGRGSGSGRGGGMGSTGKCVCMKCGYSTIKKAGIPCIDERCPTCGNVLFREGGTHYNKAKKNKEV